MRFKKIGAALLACAMCFGVFSTTAFAYVDESVATEEPAVEEKVHDKKQEETIQNMEQENAAFLNSKKEEQKETTAAGPVQIRVLLTDCGKLGYAQKQVSLRGNASLSMNDGAYIASPQETICVTEQECGEVVHVVPADETAGTAVSLTGKPEDETVYPGSFVIYKSEEGLLVVNELDLEMYLRYVVPSEMPSSYEKEALKAQAVCARTYAYRQIQSNTYSQYGAHVDDSTNFQVYNNVETNERTREAVEETYGKMLLYKGKPVSAYYFSTSCGTTTDGSIWGNDSSETPYLKSVALSPGRKTLDLTENADFSSFIKDEDYPAYDSSYPFYRWNVMTNAQILGDHIGGIGTIESVKITERGPGGVALKMLVKGSEGEKTISGQNAIRSALGDSSLTIKRKDGKTSEGWSSLPSAFLTVEDVGKNDKGITRFKIYGGGYGHGAGMSQNGAQGMAKDGMTCEEILKFFYEGVSVAEPPIGEQQAKNAQN